MKKDHVKSTLENVIEKMLSELEDLRTTNAILHTGADKLEKLLNSDITDDSQKIFMAKDIVSSMLYPSTTLVKGK